MDKCAKVFGILAGSTMALLCLVLLYAKIMGNAKVESAAGVILDKIVAHGNDSIPASFKETALGYLTEALAALPSVFAALARAKHTAAGAVNAVVFSIFPIIWFFVINHSTGLVLFGEAVLMFAFVAMRDPETQAAILFIFLCCIAGGIIKISNQ